ncbi:tRNA1(Val) (adenine(37)-N6)-methyltransferase [Asticcacaulis sp. AND118]|uniref:tRNA1(Val) (adenine(37)-N6)-methyltransferase n=1 Tax=Asticcacaulis sp. AND118 TaxID=2840468 RepID=UPI001CFFB135|nr:methyltransferase [Asticcacaulis sp. AND118]UDF05403.1 methyltransferase [Asticcacaulis sp. AND118]
MEESASTLRPDILETTLLGGRVSLWQPAKGYRIGMDGALLAAGAAGIVNEGRSKAPTVLELGCGVGGVILSLAARCPQVSATGIERDAATFALTERNLARSGGPHRAIHGDIGTGYRSFDLPRFDLVLSNPPYFDDPDTLRAPHELKRPAWIADDGLQAWLDFAQAAVVDGGDILFVHRADRLGDILGGLPKCGSFIIRPIQPFVDKEAKRVLVRAKRLGKAPLRLLPPLILHDDGERKHTPEVEAILRGEAELGW